MTAACNWHRDKTYVRNPYAVPPADRQLKADIAHIPQAWQGQAFVGAAADRAGDTVAGAAGRG